jgi:hypothetical protein
LKKGNKTPDEARMPLKQKPYVPSLVGNNVGLTYIWEEFQKTFVY